MNDSELWRRFMALRAESEALAPELRLAPARAPRADLRRVTALRIAAALLVMAGLAALLRTSAGRAPDPALRGPTSSPLSGAWTTPSDALLAPIAFDLARSVPDFSATPPPRSMPQRPTSLPTRSTR